jgi:hypothetical protein
MEKNIKEWGIKITHFEASLMGHKKTLLGKMHTSLLLIK